MKKPVVSVIGLSGHSIFMEVNSFHKEGETIKANSIHTEPGGKGFNQAVAISKLDGISYFLTSVGCDDNGKIVEDELTKQGVISSIIKSKETMTALACILTDKNGNNQVTVYPGSTNAVTEGDLEEFSKYINKSDILLLQFELPINILKKAIELAKQNKIKIVINPAPMIEELKEVLLNAWLITPNEIEAKSLFGINSEASIEDLKFAIKTSKFRRLVVTMGSKGSLLYEDGKFTDIPAHKVEVVDTTGAGDIFTAALCLGVIREKNLEDACIYASYASALSVRNKHVLNAIPSHEQVLLELNNLK